MIGQVIKEKYELLQLLGEGPVFNAYLALERAKQKQVVVRVTNDPFNSDSEFIKALNETFYKSKRIEHEFLSAVVEIDEHNGRWFMVHKYTQGQPLTDRLKKINGLGVSTSVAVAIKMLDALQVLHGVGLIHGDLRAENVVLSSAGNPTLLVPCIAESYAASKAVETAIAPKVGPYLAPECHQGAPRTMTSDVYAVGALLYELVTGEKPFRTSAVSQLSEAHATAPVPSIKRKVLSAPDVLQKVIEKAMGKSAEDRYPDAQAFKDDLTIIQDALKFGTPLGWPLAAPKSRERKRIAPKMNTVRAEEKDKKMEDRWVKDQNDGAPRWLVYVSTSLLVGALCVIGWWMLFKLNAPRSIAVPNIVGMSFAEASTLLKNYNLTLTQSSQAPSDQYPEGVILEIKPAASHTVKEGSHVFAVVSTGSKTVEVPDVTGKTPTEAKTLLDKMGLILSENVQYVFSENVNSGLIVSQRPAKRLMVAKKSKIEIEVSKGIAVEPTDEPSQPESYLYHLSWTMPDGTETVKVRVEMKDASGQKSIYESNHEPNDKVTIDIEGLGDSATFTIYYDDRVVKTFTQNAAIEPTAPATPTEQAPTEPKTTADDL